MKTLLTSLYAKAALSLLFLLAGTQVSQAQFSLMAGGAYARGTNSGRLPMLGLDGKIGVDLGTRYQVTFNANNLSPIDWEYVDNADFGFGAVSLNVPFKVFEPVRIDMNEFSLTTNYFLLGTNTSTASIYGGLGPGLRHYKAVHIDPKEKTDQLVEKSNEIYLDSRVGGQVYIGIGWLYAEGSFGPTLFQLSSKLNHYEHSTKPYLSFHTGIRFLLNKHPKCKV